MDAVHAVKMPRLGERAPPENRLSIDDDAMNNKADVASAEKPNKATMQLPPRRAQLAAVPATKAPIALTVVTAMAMGSEGAEAGAGESAMGVKSMTNAQKSRYRSWLKRSGGR